jgi:alpha-L-rhamnosidase
LLPKIYLAEVEHPIRSSIVTGKFPIAQNLACGAPVSTHTRPLLNREQYPSWLYPVEQGATTIWERWDGQKPDGSFQDQGMNSFNHYAYGAIGDWMYQVMAGIEVDPQAPGYQHVLLQPQPGGALTKVRASHDAPYGKVVAGWEMKQGRFEFTVEVPANSHATVRLPKASLEKVSESGKPLVPGDGIVNVRQEGESVVADIGSGHYAFAYPWEVPAKQKPDR